MCGVNVIRCFDNSKVNVEDLARMGSLISHRGPDGSGFSLHDDGRVGLGHVRLSVIDLQGGDQPLYNEDGSIGVVFNGEIYDYKLLREELVQKGHQFKTRSDTEVLVHMYEEYGLQFLNRLNGEFAFVLWDGKTRRLVAVKDRFGVKPLFYHVTPKRIVISSECKSILSLSDMDRDINPDFLVGSLLGGFNHEMTFFAGIKSLKPGHFLVIDRDGVKNEEAYWKLTFEVRGEMTFEEAKNEIKDRFIKAVDRRLVADVPVGAYLSGGLDSSLVCGLMSQQTNQLKTFNIGFGKHEFDESRLALRVAKHFGASFETIHCDSELMAENFEKTLHHVEQPLANPNSIAKQILSAFVRGQGYKVCLTGEGSDEIFGGYAYFKLEHIWRMRDRKRAKTLLKRFKRSEKRSKVFLWQDWKKLDPIYGYPSFHQIRMADASQVASQLFNPSLAERSTLSSPMEFFRREFSGAGLDTLDPFNASQFITLNQLSNYIIPTLGDRVEMANSVECRTPFLDKDLVEFASTIPAVHFMRIEQLREKVLLKEAFADLIPDFLFEEHKHPFLSPNWYSLCQSSAGKDLKSDCLSMKALKETGIFRTSYVKMLMFYWWVLPKSFVMWRRIDIALGLVLSTQILHRRFLRGGSFGSSGFPMVDRTPDNFSSRGVLTGQSH